MSTPEIWIVDREGTRKTVLPAANLQNMSWQRSRPGAASFTIDPLARGTSWIRWPYEVQVWMDGFEDPVWWGVPWGLSGGPDVITVNCEGLLSLFGKRFVDRTSLLYTSIDQFAIAWDLLLYAQSEAVEGNRDFNIDSDFVNSGVVRSRDYPRVEHANILDLLYEFDRTTLLNGFDWEIVGLGSGQRLWTPTMTKGDAKPNWAVEYGPGEGDRNVSNFGWAENYGPLATLYYVTGGSVTIDDVTFKKEGKHEDVAASAIYGQMQAVMSEGSQLDENWLDDRAEQEVNKHKEPEEIIDITSARGFHMDAFKQVVEGDWLPVKINYGRIQFDAWKRVEEVTWNARNTLDFTFGETVVVP